MSSPILSTGMEALATLGAYFDISAFGSDMAFLITSKIFNLASLDFLNVSLTISILNPLIFVSICTAVTPSAVPVILKSISP